MSRDNDLPFARGATYCNGDATSIANLGTELEGKIYETTDPTTGRPQRLIVLKNTSGSAWAVAGLGLKAEAGYLGRRVSAAADAQGIGFIGDPEYGTNTVADDDLFYAIFDGYVSNAKTHTTTCAEGSGVAFHSDGKIIPVAATDGFCIGVAAETVTSPSSGDSIDLLVGAPYNAYKNVA